MLWKPSLMKVFFINKNYVWKLMNQEPWAFTQNSVIDIYLIIQTNIY